MKEITLNILENLINSQYRWDIIDTLINVDRTGLSAINDIYNHCFTVKAKTTSQIIGMIINLGLLSFFSLAKLQFMFLKQDKEYYEEMYQQRLAHNINLNRDDFNNSANDVSAVTSTLLKITGLTNYVQLAFEHLFKDQISQEKFNQEIALYIYVKIQEENLPIEFITYIQQLASHLG